MVIGIKQIKSKKGRLMLFIGMAVLLLAVAAAGLWLVKVSEPGQSTLLPPCLFRQITGLYCTGCGITRSIHFIMNGQFYQGFRMNPLAVLGFPALAIFVLVLLYRLVTDKPLPSMPSWLPWAMLAVIVLYTVARNLPWEPFSWLAPTALSWVRQ